MNGDGVIEAVWQRRWTADVELLSVSLRPGYLPREFGQLFLIVFYVPMLHVQLEKLATRIKKEITTVYPCIWSPDAPNFILGDFNSCSCHRDLPTFKQYVTCSIQLNKTFHLCYGNNHDTCKSVSHPPFETSDHNTIHLIPAYRQDINRTGS